MMNIIFVLAGNYEQYRYWCRGQKYTDGFKFVFCDCIEKMYGYFPDEMVEVGSFSKRKDAKLLRDFAETRFHSRTSTSLAIHLEKIREELPSLFDDHVYDAIRYDESMKRISMKSMRIPTVYFEVGD